MFNIAKEITKIRKDLGLTQVQFSKIIGIEQPYLSKIESGKNVPTVETLIEIFSKLGYIMNIELKKEENTMEDKKSYPTSEIITLAFKNLVFRDFRDDDPTQIKFNLYYRSSEYSEYVDNSFEYRYALIKDEYFRSFLNYLNVSNNTPKKVLLYIIKHSNGITCYLRLITNSNQYKNASYVDIDLSPIFIHDSSHSSKLRLINIESPEGIEDIENVVEKVKQEEIHEPELQQYQKHLDILYEKDVSLNFSASTLSEKLEDIYQLFGDLLYLSRLDVKKDYFDRYYSK